MRQRRTWMRGALPLALLVVALLALPAAAAQGENGTADPEEEEIQSPDVLSFADASWEHYVPVVVALIVAIFLGRVLVPQNLSQLQVAFEVDDDLYEVHRLTRNRKDARTLLKTKGVGLGVAAYLMAMTGILIIVVELITPLETAYTEGVLVLTAVLILIPVILSPWETLNAQLSRTRNTEVRAKPVARFIRRFGTLIGLLAATGALTWYGITRPHAQSTAQWYFYALLLFMGPSMLAYGRIMGASWNMLMLNKWRTARGQRTPVNPDRPSIFSRLVALALVAFVITMPITALNGVLTVLYVTLEDRPWNGDILSFGGLLGHRFFEWAQLNEEWLQQWVSIKELQSTLALYLTLNVAFVGLAFIFEVARIMFLGGQVFGGVGGVTLAPPREIRSEQIVQGRLLFFCFAGFSGYTVLLLVMICYKEFSHLMPFVGWLDSQGFTSDVILLSTWYFIAAGQAAFLLTWTLSLLRFGGLRRLRFDLSPDERREGAIAMGGGDWMQDLVDNAGYAEDLDTLRRFQDEDVKGDQSIVRLQKSRALMVEMALRGLWPNAIDEARKVLAQQGGDDDEARMLICCGHMASRRLDAAREALRGLEQADGYDEPELLAFMLEWLDPWRGQVTPDDLYDWENISTIDNLRWLDERLSSWDPTSNVLELHDDRLSEVAELSAIAKMRAQRMHDEALERTIELIKRAPDLVRPRVALALCLIDQGEPWAAMDVWEQLRAAAPRDPRVIALGGLLGHKTPTDDMEAALAIGKRKEMRRWIDDAPTNAVAALSVSGGRDEALTANYWIAAGEAVERNASPHLRSSAAWTFLQFFVIWVGSAAASWWFGIEGGNRGAIIAAGTIVFGHLVWRRIQRNSMRIIKHRDQTAMVVHARRLARRKVKMDVRSIPVGTHLLLSGLLVTVNGNVYDLGYPAWLTERLPKEVERRYQQRMRKRQRRYIAARSAQLKPLQPEWWQKKQRDDDAGVLVRELLGSHARFGGSGQQAISGRAVGAQAPKRAVEDLDYEDRHIPHDSIKSERERSSPLDIPGLIALPGKDDGGPVEDDELEFKPRRRRASADEIASRARRIKADFSIDD